MFKRERNLELLYQLSQSLTQTLDPVEVAEKAIQLTTTALGGCQGVLYLLDHPAARRLTLLAASANYSAAAIEQMRSRQFLEVGCGLEGSVAAERRPIVAPDVSQEPRWIHVSGLSDHIHSAVALPLLVQDDLIGVIVFTSRVRNFFTAADLPTLLAIAGPIALSLQNAHLFAAERRRRQEAETLRLVTSTPILDLRLEQVLQELLERLRQVIPLDSGCFMLLKQDQLQAVAGIGFPDPDAVVGCYFPVSNELFRQVEGECRAIYYRDVREIAGFQGWGGTGYVRGWMGVPLLHRGVLIGYLTLDSREVGAYGEGEAALAQAFANQATITIVNAQLLQDSQRAALEQRAVSQILRQLNATSQVPEILPAIVDGLHDLTACDAVELALFPEEEGQVQATRYCYCSGTAAEETIHHTYGLADSAACAAILQGQIHQITELAGERDFPVESACYGAGYVVRLNSPLQINQRTLGMLQLLWRSPVDVQGATVAAFAQIADAVAMAVDKSMLFGQTRRRVNEMELLNAFTLILRPLETSREIMQVALNWVMETFQGVHSYICMPSEDPDRLDTIFEIGPVKTHRQVRNHPDDSLTGRVFNTGRPYLSKDIFSDSVVNGEWQSAWNQAGYQVISAILAPLHTRDQVIGVISVAAPASERTYTQDDLRLFTTMAEILGTALHRTAVLETLEQRVLDRTHELAEANSRLRALDRLKSEFVANVSHELRTPLTNIRFYLELLNRGRVEKREQYLAILSNETDRLYQLIESILDLSRLNAIRTQGGFAATPVDISSIARDICQNHNPQAQAKGILLDCQAPPQRLTILGDRNQIVQVVTNLMANAINYTERGGRVALSVRPARDGVEIEIQDTGMGIEADELAHLFERFYRSQRVANLGIPGTGLGLSIVKEIIDLHSGTVDVQSRPGQGSTFTVWFPAPAEP